MTRFSWIGAAGMSCVFGVALPASAQHMPEAVIDTGARPSQCEWKDMCTPGGASITLGGGTAGFIDKDVRNYTSVGGSWEARVAYGTRTLLTGEVAYVGFGQDITALGLDPSAALLGNGAEGVARLNFLPGSVQPYVLAGAGWIHWSVISEDYNTSSVEDHADVAQFPLGVGLSYRYEGLLADLRGVIRPMSSADIVSQTGSMTSWNAALHAGVEF